MHNFCVEVWVQQDLLLVGQNLSVSSKCFHSELLSPRRESQSSFIFSLLGRYSTVIMMWLTNRYFQVYLPIIQKLLVVSPPPSPIFTRYVLLSFWRSMVIADVPFVNGKIKIFAANTIVLRRLCEEKSLRFM